MEFLNTAFLCDMAVINQTAVSQKHGWDKVQRLKAGMDSPLINMNIVIIGRQRKANVINKFNEGHSKC